ncbi:DsbA family protein [Modestobacter lapidis]|nr:DsbA family protein [Modestobacter lapidis]
MSTPENQPDGVAFWFDPSCPFTWQTSRWLAEVAAARGMPVDWRVMSLVVLNGGGDVPGHPAEEVARGAVATRVFAAVRSAAGPEVLGRFYTEVGTRVHEQGADLGPDVFREALAAVGLPAELAEDDDAQQAAVEASHAESQQRVGAEAGSPITAFAGGPGFFGPIVTPAPTGDDALRLFDGLALVSAVPGFSELKGARGELP